MPLSRIMTLETAEVLKPFHLTPGERPFYLTLISQDGITQEALTAEVQVDKSATARVLDSLERKGLVTRRRNEQDRRSNLIYLTEKARRMYPDVMAALTEFNQQFVQLLTEEEYDTTFYALQKMEDYLLERHRQRLSEEGVCHKHGHKHGHGMPKGGEPADGTC